MAISKLNSVLSMIVIPKKRSIAAPPVSLFKEKSIQQQLLSTYKQKKNSFIGTRDFQLFLIMLQ